MNSVTSTIGWTAINYLLTWEMSRNHLKKKYKTEQNLIEGCQSRVWLQADDVDGKIVFKAESDALIVKGNYCLID